MTLPFQGFLDRRWPAGHLLTDDAVLCLALLITCAIPFKSWHETPRGSSSKTSRPPSEDSKASERGESAVRTVTGHRYAP
jgi:hypothetical protein